MYRHVIKKCCNDANNKQRNAESNIRLYMANKKFWDDYSDSVIDAANRDILLFRMAIKQQIDNAKCEHSKLISHCETARCLLDMAVFQFDYCVEEAKKRYGRDFSQIFIEYRVGDVLSSWTRLCKLLYGNTHLEVDLNSERAQQAFDIICRKFSDGEYISACLSEAQKEHPEFANSIIQRG